MPSPPAWLAELANHVAGEFEPVDVLAPIGCHFHQAGEIWEITLFAAATEIVGGREDGRHKSSRFRIDLEALRSIFTEIERCEWQAQDLGPGDELGSHVAVEGLYRGHRVWLRIPSRAPERFTAGREVDVYQQIISERW